MKSTKENHPREDVATAAKAMGTEIDPVYINPLTDFGFKKLFCSDRRGAERLLALLRSFLPDKMEGVTDIPAQRATRRERGRQTGLLRHLRRH